jgi:hypothetical protein
MSGLHCKVRIALQGPVPGASGADRVDSSNVKTSGRRCVAGPMTIYAVSTPRLNTFCGKLCAKQVVCGVRKSQADVVCSLIDRVQKYGGLGTTLYYFQKQSGFRPDPVVVSLIDKQYASVRIRDDHGGQGCIVAISQGL